MLIVGLTGGIGSGKTTVAKIFEALGIAVYYTDIEAKKLMHTSKIIRRKLITRFGEEVYKDNMLNKPFLANLIFTNKANLAFVNSVVHPKVNQHFKRWVKKQEKLGDTKYVMQENAILFENRSAVFCDKIITVTAPLPLKIERVVKRDNTSKKQVIERMDNQWSDEDKIKKSDFVIHNINLSSTESQVNVIHKQLLSLSNL
jgi:dephospho-CoA kinase